MFFFSLHYTGVVDEKAVADLVVKYWLSKKEQISELVCVTIQEKLIVDMFLFIFAYILLDQVHFFIHREGKKRKIVYFLTANLQSGSAANIYASFNWLGLIFMTAGQFFFCSTLKYLELNTREFFEYLGLILRKASILD